MNENDDEGSGRDQPRRLWPEPWASAATVEADNLDGQLDRALALLGPNLSKPAEATRDAVCHLLDGARKATDLKTRWFVSPLDRWRGTSLERAHYCLHGAKIALVDVLPEEDIDALIPTAAARLSSSLPTTDVRLVDIEALLTSTAPADPSRNNPEALRHKRAVLKRALQIGYEATDQQHARVRGFRNLLFVIAATIFLFMAVLVVIVSREPSSVPFCFSPGVEVPATSGLTADQIAANAKLVRSVCPSGHDPSGGVLRARASRGSDVFIVAGLGMIGGALAAAVAIRNIRGTSTPYDIPLALAALKVPTGALTAVAGNLLLGGGFLPGLSELDSQGQILAYALVFGYAQQLVTQLIDKQALSVLDALPSKDSTGRQPAHGAVVPAIIGNRVPQVTAATAAEDPKDASRTGSMSRRATSHDDHGEARRRKRHFRRR